MRYDVIVIGLGGMGSAVLDALARSGLAVLGIDRNFPPHNLGSTHGKSRIIRLAYMEDPAYVPLLRRAYELWSDLEAASGTRILQVTGGLMIGTADSDAVRGSRASALEHELPHTMLDAAEIRRRFPQFEPPADYVALYEEIAGALAPERCIEIYLTRAAAAGATVRAGARVDGWDSDGDRIHVEIGEERHEAAQLVITAGPWLAELLPAFAPSLQVTRQIMHWFEPRGGAAPYLPDRFPVYIWEPPEGDVFYGFPALDGLTGGVKVAIHHGGEATTAEAVDREVHPGDIDRIRACLRGRIPALDGDWLEGAVCMYTNTPDDNFILGTLPDLANVHVAGGLSGHGFKFASVVGEIMADLVQRGATVLPIGPFAPGRFAL